MSKIGKPIRSRLNQVERGVYEKNLSMGSMRSAKEDAEIILELDDALIIMTKRYEDQLSCWQVSEHEFITKREAGYLAKIAELEKRPATGPREWSITEQYIIDGPDLIEGEVVTVVEVLEGK